MPSRSDKGTPRCLLCSMHCPIGADIDALGHLSTVFPADLGAEQGACVRALTAARLVDVPERIFAARRGDEATSADLVIQSTVTAASGFDPAQMALIIDLNRPLEGVLAAAGLCRLGGVRFCAWAPPEDTAFVRAGLTSCPPFGQIADCNLVLAIGDPFGSHPAIASPVRDVQFGERGNRLICIDSAWGRTARAANEAVTVGPLKLAGFVSALAVACGATGVGDALGGKSAEEICSALDLPVERVNSLAAALKGAESVGIVLSHSVGRYSAGSAAAGAVREMASALGAKVWPLLVSTNSAALPHLKRTFGAVEIGELIRDAEAGRLKALLVIGFDPAAALPERLWKPLSEKCEFLGWAGSLEGPFAEGADQVLPLAFPWEEGGTVLDPAGSPVEFVPWLPKPPTVLTAKELISQLVSYAGLGAPQVPGVDELMAGACAETPLQDLITPAILEAAQPEGGHAVVIGSPEPQGYTGGISLAYSSWQRRLAAEEMVSLSADLAAELGVSEQGLVVLGNGREVTVPCRAAVGEGRAAALPAHWGLLRELLQWRGEDGVIEPAPALVKIRKCD